VFKKGKIFFWTDPESCLFVSELSPPVAKKNLKFSPQSGFFFFKKQPCEFFGLLFLVFSKSVFPTISPPFLGGVLPAEERISDYPFSGLPFFPLRLTRVSPLSAARKTSG